MHKSYFCNLIILKLRYDFYKCFVLKIYKVKNVVYEKDNCTLLYKSIDIKQVSSFSILVFNT